jgi:PadR family transcriptional regulator PadR
VGKQVDLLQGILEVLILKAVSLGPLHGYGILLRIEQLSGDRIQIPQGSFYVALYRIEHKVLITGEWGESENNRRAKFYRLTAEGARQLKLETGKWSAMTSAVDAILSTAKVRS